MSRAWICNECEIVDKNHRDWIQVEPQRVFFGMASEYHFCSWNCLALFSMSKHERERKSSAA